MNRLTLQWLYHCHAVTDILKQCEQLKETEKCIYKLLIHFDACELLEFSVELGEALLHRPGGVWPVLVEVVFALVSTLSPLPHLTSSSQLLLLVRLSSIPALPLYQINHVTDLLPLKTEPRFYSFSGVVTAISMRESFTEAACFQCLRECCPDNQHYIRLHTTGATEAMVMQSSGCHLCGYILTEDLSHRVLSDKVYISLVPRHVLSMCSRAWERHQSLQFVLRGDLCDLVHLGGEYEVIGVPTFTLSDDDQHSAVKTLVEVNNLLSIYTPLPHTLPAPLDDLYKAARSPWTVSCNLAYNFADHISPPGSYHRLKLGILLSLASLSSSGNQKPLSIVAIGTDFPLLNELLNYGSYLAKRSTIHSTTFDLFGGARKEGSSFFMEGGALLLAEEGVCLLGDLDVMKKDLKDKLERSFESNQVELSSFKRLGLTEVTSVSLPLGCAVWGLSRHSDTNSISKPLLDQLGLLLFSDPSTCYEDTLSASITRHALDRATGHLSSPLMTSEQLREVVALATRVESVMDKEAEAVIESFYTSSRRVRGSDMPNTALKIMKSITLSHAKLRLSQVATKFDALLAILLYEEGLIGQLGYSVLNVTPSPHLKLDSDDYGCIDEFADFMSRLSKRLVEFCKCANPAIALREE